MATLVLQAAGAALGSVFGPVGAVIGRAAGALAGNLIDNALLSSGQTVSARQLSSARIPGADEGTAINRVYGTARISGTLIWATRFEEEVTSERSGAKGSGPRIETFRYFANFALGLCEGEIACVRRVWADGQELDLTDVTMRIYRGTDDQAPDPLIEAKQGVGMAPAYRGLAYAVFERLPLDAYGNRLPVLQFEVLRVVGRLERQVKAITIIPGATEHGYSPVKVTEKTGDASARVMNRTVLQAATDWEASLDELQALCPNLDSVALVVSWFGTDLRAGQCRIVPGVEIAARNSESVEWRVCGKTRATAHLVSQSSGGPAFGGTPNDASVVAAIADLKARGLKVFLYPFVMMDVPAGNTLPDPYGGTGQAVYPWRGRITCHPAIGQAGTVDRTAAARTQINAFAGAAVAADFSVSGTQVAYSGTEESYRRMLLHYALLAQAAGGVDGFILASEYPGLTTVRDETGAFPFVEKLVGMAADVRAILGPSTKLTYGADWTEYFGYHPQDGSGDVYFHLDPLWASANIDAVGIDNYMPLADWRDADMMVDNPDGFALADDVDGMKRMITSGEGFDWYYASSAARKARTRTAITDGLAGKPWVFRYKDLENWWGHRHYNRVGGAELVSPTAWTAGAKPIWFTELGCPAIDRGANQPNVFADPKSSENAFPYFSGGQRSDCMQRRFLDAHHDWWSSSAPPAGMVAEDRMFLWAWDARPLPAFPFNAQAFADGDNWRTGHWLTGRLGAGTLPEVIAAILRDHGVEDYDVSAVSGDLIGYVQGEITSARQLIEPLISAFQLDASDVDGVLTFRSRGKAAAVPTMISVLADGKDEPLWLEMRGQESDFAAQAILDHFDEAQAYDPASLRSRQMATGTERVLRASISGVLNEETAADAVEGMLRDHRLGRRTLSFALSPKELALQPGDAVRLDDGPDGTFVVTRIEDGDSRKVEAREFAASLGPVRHATTGRRKPGTEASSSFAPVLHLMDLPRYGDGAASDYACGAVLSRPWRAMLLSSSPGTEGYKQRLRFDRPAKCGVLVEALAPGISGRFDFSRELVVRMQFGSLASGSKLAVLNGDNKLAVKAANGEYEIISFLSATETAANVWTLTGLLRGQAGTTDAMLAGAAAGAELVVLDAAVKPLGLTAGETGLSINWIVEAAGTAAGGAGPFSFAGGVRAETPLAPVHLRARRQASGDVLISWLRCGREDADSWQAEEIPLEEPSERYRIQILNGASIVETAVITASQYTYAAASELADFGAQQGQLSLRVRQLGRKVANGIAAEAVVAIQ